MATMVGDLARFGREVRRLRLERGWTQAELAEQAGDVVSRVTITAYEQGTRNPSGLAASAIARALGVTVEYLLYGPNGDEHAA